MTAAAPVLGPADHIAAWERDSVAFAAAIAQAPASGRVPSCPEWSVVQLAVHLGSVYDRVRVALAGGGDAPAADAISAPAEPGAEADWYRRRRDGLSEAFAGLSGSEPAWVWLPGATATAAWWMRRMAQETSIHLWDALDAAGAAEPIDPALAADGADEYLVQLLPFAISRVTDDALRGSFHAHCTDTPGEWTLDLSAPGLDVRREHSKAEAAVRGRASAIDLWLWKRLTPEAAGLDRFGDGAVIEALGRVRL